MSKDLHETHAIDRVDNDTHRTTAALIAAAGRIAPAWSLRDFVAVNPFVGVKDMSFAGAAQRLADVDGGRMTMPRSFYARAIKSGRIREDDLADAARAAAGTVGFEGDGQALRREALVSASRPEGAAKTVAEIAAELTDVDWHGIVADRIGTWAESYYGDGPAQWRSPWPELAPFAAWRQEAALDRVPEVFGAAHVREWIEALPTDHVAAADVALNVLEMDDADSVGLERYLHRLGASVRGWAAWCRGRDWHESLGTDSHVVQLLCIRLAWEAALLTSIPDPRVAARWQEAKAGHRGPSPRSRAIEVDVLLHDAYERGVHRALLAQFPAPRPPERVSRAAAQVAFCIDVRSERIRRALERTQPLIETIGVAGFFGMPLEVGAPGDEEGVPHCPALIRPAYEASDASKERRGWLAEALGTLKDAGVSTFAYVETLGLAYAAKLIADAFSLRRREPPRSRAVMQDAPLSARIELAEKLLRAMSLTKDFARIVMLCGHAAQTVNNPFAAGLMCGACGGHSGGPNARIAAAILNDEAVRDALKARGIGIPTDTIFVAAVHETVTDTVHVLDPEHVPAGHATELRRLREELADAGRLCRDERPELQAESPDQRLAEAEARAQEWSEVRPEWGLASCSSFIIAPRHRTRGVSLGARTFLHSYAWTSDEEFGVLEALMTAPLVVASWISLQYFGSTVDPAAHGAGNKTLHNVIGDLGVVEGGYGDLRVGLPLQCVHDGADHVHEPVRLTAIIEAPTEAMSAIIRRQPELANLLDNGWLHLLAMDEQGAVTQRYVGKGRWAPLSPSESVGSQGPRLAS